MGLHRLVLQVTETSLNLCPQTVKRPCLQLMDITGSRGKRQIPYVNPLEHYIALYLLLYCSSFTCCYKLAVDVVDTFYRNCESGTRLIQDCLKMAFIFHTDRCLSWCFCAVRRGRGSSTLKESATCFVEWVLRVLHPPLETKRGGAPDERHRDGNDWCLRARCPPAPLMHTHSTEVVLSLWEFSFAWFMLVTKRTSHLSFPLSDQIEKICGEM